MLRMNKQRGALRRDLGLLLVIAVLLTLAMFYQHRRFKSVTFQVEVYEQKMELPPSQVLKFATLGYDSIYADWLWLQSIQFFGSGWRTEDQTTKPIFQYFDTLTDMDPHFISAYRFANLIIGDQRGDHVLGQEILRKGIHKNPHNYDLPYLGIYNAIWSMNDTNDARWFAYRLDRIPEAPAFMKRMDEYIERKAGRFDLAFEFNVRYYLEYLAADNDVERDIAKSRMQDLLNRLYHARFKEGVLKYLEVNGEHPRRMEDLLDPRYLEPYDAPTVYSFAAALEQYADEIELLSADKAVPEELVDRIVKASQQRIVGLPPEPFGTWYFISTPTRDLVAKAEDFDLATRETVPYIINAQQAIDHINAIAIEAQRAILNFIDETGSKPMAEDIQEYLIRDLLGGHFVYERDPEDPELKQYGIFYSTAAKRYEAGNQPRVGISGPGPFPFPLEPSLKEFPEEFEWGLDNGYILPDGTEIHVKPTPPPDETESTGEAPAEESSE